MMTIEQLEETGRTPTRSQEVQGLCQKALESTKTKIAALIALPKKERTFQNTIAEIDAITVTLWTPGNFAYLLKEVHPDPAIREVGEKCVLELEKYHNELMLRRDFFDAVSAYEPGRLKGEDLVFYKDLMRAFKRSGVDLPEAKRNELKAIKDELSLLDTEFSRNIAADKTVLTVSAAELAGLPERNMKALEKQGDHFLLKMDYPTVQGVMQFVTVEETRKKVQKAFNNRAAPQNIAVLEKLIEKRHMMAQLLGYDSYASYQLEDLMAQKPKAVRTFLDELRPLARKKAKQDYKALETLKRKITNDSAAVVENWDKAFLRNLIKEQKYKIDENQVAEYFSVESVINGLYQISERLFQIKMKEVDAPWKWHPDVKMYEVSDPTSGKLIGRFYTDLYPRENKYSHAAKFGLVSGRTLPDASYRVPTVAIVANFPKPTPTEPALLKHSDVETFFHEFGHCIHSLLTEAKYSSHSGTSVSQDFVEAPSQMLEGWVWEEESLALFARHYKTGKPLPKSLLKSMIEAKNLNSGIDAEQQIYYSDLSLSLYEAGQKVDSTRYVRELQERDTLFKYVPDTFFQASFGHLSGYGAAYYGYQWSAVYAEDMFTRFSGNKLLSAKVGMDYRKKVLSRGSGRDEMDSVVDFLGRKPNAKAYFKSLGLK